MDTKLSKSKHLRKPKKWSAHFAKSNFKKAQEDLISLNAQLPHHDRFPLVVFFSVFFPNSNVLYSSQQGQMRYLPWWANNEFLPCVLDSLHDFSPQPLNCIQPFFIFLHHCSPPSTQSSIVIEVQPLCAFSLQCVWVSRVFKHSFSSLHNLPKTIFSNYNFSLFCLQGPAFCVNPNVGILCIKRIPQE